MPKSVRVRFAPSPTGLIHVGGLRSALFNYLYAKHTGGSFILRFEDTDRERLVPEAVKQIEESMMWLGLEWDEGVDKGGKFGPYVQSERLELYQKYANELVQKGFAYKDYTPTEKLEELRREAQSKKQPFKFSKEMAQTDGEGDFVIRFHVHYGKDVTWDDAVWGKQSWQREVLDDFVAIKSDGFPTYNFANVVDDHLMEITHVFRGSEFLATAPKNLLVYEAFGWQPPEFVHLPPVLGPDKAKLSKRHGAKSALEYREEGYLPEAVFNYLASLGFNDGTTKEIYSRSELVEVFALDRIQSSPAVFDQARLEWMNGIYIRQLPIAELAKAAESYWPDAAKKSDDKYKHQVLSLVQERLRYLSELPELTEFFFADPEIGEEQVAKLKKTSAGAESILNEVAAWLDKTDFEEAALEDRLRELAKNSGEKTGVIFGLIRIAVTGKTAAPGIFETLATLGRESSLRRIHAVIDALLS